MTVLRILMAISVLLGVAVKQYRASLGDFNVTSGSIEKRDDMLFVGSKQMRAELKAQTQQRVTVNLTYLGPTKQVSFLQNGDIRHQFGLKLRAKNVCNVVYAMWDFDLNRMRVSVKSNPGMSRFEQCRDNGYIGLPSVAVPVVLSIGEPHVITADLDGIHLTVSVDGHAVVDADLPEPVDFDGPLGLRSDNAAVKFDFTVRSDE